MSPRRGSRVTPGKRVPYRAPRDRRELWTAIAVACLIVVVTATLVWFLRPNRESAGTPSRGGVTFNEASSTTTTPPTDSTAAPTDTTAPADTTPTEGTAAGGG